MGITIHILPQPGAVTCQQPVRHRPHSPPARSACTVSPLTHPALENPWPPRSPTHKQAAWLLKRAGVAGPTPQEFDDPNTTLGNLLLGCKNLGFAPPTYPQARLLGGWGKEVVGLLEALAEVVLERSGWTPAHISRPLPGWVLAAGGGGGQVWVPVDCIDGKRMCGQY